MGKSLAASPQAPGARKQSSLREILSDTHANKIQIFTFCIKLLSSFLKYLCFKTSLRVKLSVKNEFDLHENEHVGGTFFHMNALARSLVLIQTQYSADIFVLNYKLVAI